jgi:SAM-dependent methyltransferase
VKVVTAHGPFWREVFPGAEVIEDAARLNLSEGSADLVIHALALHRANDPVGQIVQCARALRPDGLFLAALPGGETLQELRASLSEAEIAVSGGLSPRVFPMGEIRDLGALLQRAGLALPVADSVKHRVSYRSLTQLMRELRGMNEGNILSDRHRRPPPRRLFELAQQIYASHYPDPEQPGTGRILATFELMFLTGWRPDASQQKPLRPGSAEHRLADALNAVMLDEKDAPDTGRENS